MLGGAAYYYTLVRPYGDPTIAEFAHPLLLHHFIIAFNKLYIYWLTYLLTYPRLFVSILAILGNRPTYTHTHTQTSTVLISTVGFLRARSALDWEKKGERFCSFFFFLFLFYYHSSATICLKHTNGTNCMCIVIFEYKLN